jgi:antitoxin CptB
MDARFKRKKRLLYQSWYRGCKETDQIIGGYAKKHIEKMSDLELDELEEILAQNDNDLYDWLSNKKPMPEKMAKNSVMIKLKDFVPSKDTR